jgi:hypothetical protein
MDRSMAEAQPTGDRAEYDGLTISLRREQVRIEDETDEEGEP